MQQLVKFSTFRWNLISVFLFLSVSGIMLFSGCEKSPQEVKKEQKERLTPLYMVAPISLSKEVPLKGEEGKDAYGYPTQYVDCAMIKSLLIHRKYSELTKYFEQFQNAFEKDNTFEYWPIDASEAFRSAEKELLPRLSEWVAKYPNSFAPYLARGSYYSSLGFALRGAKPISKTSELEVVTMQQAHGEAVKNLMKALEIRPKLVAAMRKLMQVYAGSHQGLDIPTLLKMANEQCPECFQIQVTAIMNRTPRWGGSYEEMQKMADEAAKKANPKLKLLAGYISYDKAEIHYYKDRYKEALEEINRACSLGDHWEFLLMRGKIHLEMKQMEPAFADFDLSVSSRPDQSESLAYRSYLHARQERYEVAAKDLLRALQLDPNSHTAKNILKGVVSRLEKAANKNLGDGRLDDALRQFDLLMEIQPWHKSVQKMRPLAILGQTPPTEQTIVQLMEEIKKHPDNVLLYRKLDYSISKVTKDFNKIVEYWTNFIQRNPDCGRAYIERAGSYTHLNQMVKATDDAKMACLNGISEGCFLAKALGVNPLE